MLSSFQVFRLTCTFFTLSPADKSSEYYFKLFTFAHIVLCLVFVLCVLFLCVYQLHLSLKILNW